MGEPNSAPTCDKGDSAPAGSAPWNKFVAQLPADVRSLVGSDAEDVVENVPDLLKEVLPRMINELDELRRSELFEESTLIHYKRHAHMKQVYGIIRSNSMKLVA